MSDNTNLKQDSQLPAMPDDQKQATNTVLNNARLATGAVMLFLAYREPRLPPSTPDVQRCMIL